MAFGPPPGVDVDAAKSFAGAVDDEYEDDCAAAATASVTQPMEVAMEVAMAAAAAITGAALPPHSSTGLLVVELE